MVSVLLSNGEGKLLYHLNITRTKPHKRRVICPRFAATPLSSISQDEKNKYTIN